jgi:hypothetical protein
MNRLPMSSAAASLLRALLGRAGVSRDRILLTEIHSTDWQSLTFIGERHVIHFTVPGFDSASVAAELTDGLAETEFTIPGQIVADIAFIKGEMEVDGSIDLKIEALTIAE